MKDVIYKLLSDVDADIGIAMTATDIHNIEAWERLVSPVESIISWQQLRNEQKKK